MKEYNIPAPHDASWAFVRYVESFASGASAVIEVDLCGDPGSMITERWLVERSVFSGIIITDANLHVIKFSSVANIIDFRVTSSHGPKELVY